MENGIIIGIIILALSLFIILLTNYKLKNKIITTLFFVYSLLFLILILFFDNNFVIVFLRNLITYIWYPNYLVFVVITIFTIINLIFNGLKQKNFFKSIADYLLFIIAFTSYLIFQTLNIDITSVSNLYSNSSLILLRTTTISFVTWIIINIILKIVGDKNEK